MSWMISRRISRSPSRTGLLACPQRRSAFHVDHLNQGLDIPERICEGLLASRVAVDDRHVIRPEHAVVTDFLVYAQGADHVHVAIVRKSLLKVREAASDIAEVHVEDLATHAEVPDHIEDLVP